MYIAPKGASEQFAVGVYKHDAPNGATAPRMALDNRPFFA
jgi:hypothetical protein